MDLAGTGRQWGPGRTGLPSPAAALGQGPAPSSTQALFVEVLVPTLTLNSGHRVLGTLPALGAGPRLTPHLESTLNFQLQLSIYGALYMLPMICAVCV